MTITWSELTVNMEKRFPLLSTLLSLQWCTWNWMKILGNVAKISRPLSHSQYREVKTHIWVASMNLNRITGTRQVPSGIINHKTCKDFVMELKCPSRESNTSSMSNERPHKRYWLIWKSVFQFSFEWTKKFQWYFWNRPTKSHDSFDIYKRRCFFISYSIFFQSYKTSYQNFEGSFY